MGKIEEVHDEEPTKDQLIDEAISEWERKRYVPKAGEPDLPPQLRKMANKSVDDYMKEFNKMPFFMTQLEDDDGENTQLEALKALAYEGEPREIATNFKNQGNDCYKVKRYKDAIEYYNKAIGVDCGDEKIEAALYLNRAACNLELKNYRRCIDDCKMCLKIEPNNVKACFRSAKAFFAIGKLEEASAVAEYALGIDPENAAVKSVMVQVADKKAKLKELEEKKQRELEEKKFIQDTLETAIQIRGMKIIRSSKPPEILENSVLRLEDSKDPNAQLIFPAMILYPTTDEFDFVAEVSELTTVRELMELVMDRPEEYFKDPKHENFVPKKLEAYMETERGGLIKIGKKIPINNALMAQNVKVPLFDNSLRIYFVPKVDSANWLKTWDEQKALNRRS